MFSNHTALNNKKQEPNKSLLSGRDHSNWNISGINLDNPVSDVSEWFAARTQFFDGLIKLQAQKGHSFKTTSKELAEVCGIHPSTVDRELRWARDNNLVYATYADSTGKTVALSPWFSLPDVKRQLMPYLKSLALLPLFLLASLPLYSKGDNLLLSRKLTPLRVKGNIYINYYNNHSAPPWLRHGSCPIMSEIRKVDSVRFTPADQVDLMKYHSDAIAYADRKVTWFKGQIRDPRGIFHHYCLEWHAERGVKLYLKRLFLRRKLLGIKHVRPLEGIPMVFDNDDEAAQLRKAFADAPGQTQLPFVGPVKRRRSTYENTQYRPKPVPVVVKQPDPVVVRAATKPSTGPVNRSPESWARYQEQRAQYDAEARALYEYRQRSQNKNNDIKRISSLDAYIETR